jgi:hypothetical protein
MRHLIHEGKMDNKIAYIEFKNNFFPKYISFYKKQLMSYENSQS